MPKYEVKGEAVARLQLSQWQRSLGASEGRLLPQVKRAKLQDVGDKGECPPMDGAT